MDIVQLLDKLDLGISWCYPTEKSIQIVKEHLTHPEKDMGDELKDYCMLFDTANIANMLITCLILNDVDLAKIVLRKVRSDIQDRIKNEMLPALMKDIFFLEECARIINNSNNVVNSDDELIDDDTEIDEEPISNGKNIIDHTQNRNGYCYIACYSDKGVRRHIRLRKTAMNSMIYDIVIDSAEAVDRWATPFFKNYSDAVNFINRLDSNTVKTKRDISSYKYVVNILVDGKMGPIKNTSNFRAITTNAGDCYISEFAKDY